MHLLGAALAYHRDDASGGRAADQRIVDDDRLLAVEYPRLGIEFDLYAGVARGPLDEGAADAVADDA
ncbi:MAG: hypothetical protein ACLUEQ_01365 [Cloacibacillus evryensis]